MKHMRRSARARSEECSGERIEALVTGVFGVLIDYIVEFCLVGAMVLNCSYPRFS
jgi:hypothetical protein